IQLLRQGPAFFTDLLLTNHHLDAAGLVPDVDKEGLAHAAALHDTAGGAHRGHIFGRMRPLPDGVDGFMFIEASAPGIEPEVSDSSQLFAATGLNTFGRFRQRRISFERTLTGEIWIVVGA